MTNTKHYNSVYAAVKNGLDLEISMTSHLMPAVFQRRYFRCTNELLGHRCQQCGSVSGDPLSGNCLKKTSTKPSKTIGFEMHINFKRYADHLLCCQNKKSFWKRWREKLSCCERLSRVLSTIENPSWNRKCDLKSHIGAAWKWVLQYWVLHSAACTPWNSQSAARVEPSNFWRVSACSTIRSWGEREHYTEGRFAQKPRIRERNHCLSEHFALLDWYIRNNCRKYHLRKFDHVNSGMLHDDKSHTITTSTVPWRWQ